MERPRRFPSRRATIIGLPLLALAIAGGFMQSAPGGVWLAGMVSRAASSPDMALSIGAIEHPLSSTVVARDIALADGKGVWLRVDRVAIDWARLALFGARAEIERVAIGKVEALRRPEPAPAAARTTAKSDGPMIPRLPVTVHVAAYALDHLILAEPIAGAAMDLALGGGADLGANGAALTLNVKRLDAPGAIATDVAFDPNGGHLRLNVDAREPAGGLVARMAKIPGLPPVEISLAGDGPLDDFRATLAAVAGDAIGAKGTFAVTRKGDARAFSAALDARVAPLLPVDVRPLFAATTQVEATGAVAADGATTLDHLTLTAAGLSANAAGSMDAKGVIDATASVHGAPEAGGAAFRARTLDARAHATGVVARLDVALQAVAEDFAFKSGHFGRLDADIRTRFDGGPLAATVSATIEGPRSGVAALDGLLGKRVAITGVARTLADGGFGFENFSVAGENARADIDGAATKETATVVARLDIPQVKRADARVTGHASATAKLSGSLLKPDLAFEIALVDATALGRGVPRLALKGEAHDLLGDANATASLDGTIDGKTARGSARAARAGKGFVIDGLDVAIGRATLKGAVTLDEAQLATGRLALSVPDLDDLSAMALQKLAGQFNADIALEASAGGQNVSVTASGAAIRAPQIALDRLSARIAGRDVLRRPALDGEASVENVRVGKETITRARVTAKPDGAGAALDVAVDARGFAILGRALLTPGERMRVDIASLSAQRGGQRLSLAGPAVVTTGAGRTDIKGLAVNIGGGRLDIDGSVGERLDIIAKARAIPLSVANMADASLALEGALNGEARIGGDMKAPTGDWKVTIAKLVSPQTKSNGLPAIDIAASGRLAGGRTSVDADVALGTNSRVKVGGSAPVDGAGALDVTIKGLVDAALANTALAANGQTLRGKANLDMRVTGSAAAPMFAGEITMADGAFADPLNGVNLDKINARVEARGRELNIASLGAATRNGGQISATGHVAIAPDQGMPGAIHVTARNAQLASTDTVSATADLDLDISGAMGSAPKVNGRVTIQTMDVTVPDRIPASLKPLPGTIHIDAKGFARQMLELERRQKAKAAARKSSFDATLELAISAPNRIFVRGRGIDAEFGGDLKLNGSILKPNAMGAFDLRRGKMQLLAQRIDLTSGKLTFAGGLTPELDFVASTTAGDVTANVGVSGPANAPVFAFTSTPELPSDEVLSRLLFAKASGSLSPFQAVQLAGALAQFSGAGSGIDAFEKMRKALGVDSLDIDASGSNGPRVGASRYISDNISVGVKTGTKPEESAVNVGVDVTKRIRVQGETSMDGKTSVGVGVEWEY